MVQVLQMCYRDTKLWKIKENENTILESKALLSPNLIFIHC